MLYYSFIHPYFLNGISTWGNTNKNEINKLYKIQKRAIRIISNSNYREHTLHLFKQLHILPIQLLYKHTTLPFMYQVSTGSFPEIILNLINKKSTRTTRQNDHYVLPRSHCRAFENSLLVQGPRNILESTWASLYQFIRKR